MDIYDLMEQLILTCEDSTKAMEYHVINMPPTFNMYPEDARYK